MNASTLRCSLCGRVEGQLTAAREVPRAPCIPDLLRVTDLEFVRASAHDVASGLLGWIRFTLGGVVSVDSVAVRLTRGGRISFAFPGRTSRSGILYPYITLRSHEARHCIEQQVLTALGCQGGAP